MKKIYLALFLSILWTSTLFAETIDGITYTLNNSTNTATVTNTPAGSVSIPATITYNNRTYNVTTISVVNSGVTSVEIAEGITEIGTAFQKKSNLTSISLPSTIGKLDAKAFAGCQALTSIVIPDGVTTIGNYAFGGCIKLSDVTIPSTVKSMGNAVFFNCKNIHRINWNAIHCADFQSTSQAPFTYRDDGNPYDSYPKETYYNDFNYYFYTGNNNWTTSIVIGDDVEYIPYYLFYGFTGITEIKLPNKVKEIGKSAFCGCSNVTSVSLNNDLQVIGEYAFYGTAIQSITIPDNVTSIHAYAFQYCSSLQTVTIGKGISSIGAKVFSKYSTDGKSQIAGKLSTINIYAVNPPVIQANVFEGYTDLMAITLNVREKAYDAYKAADVWKDMYVQKMENDIRTFTLTVSSADEKQGTTTPSGEYDEDTEVLIYAAAKDGYQFSKWSDGNTDNPRTIKMTGDLSFTAQFVPVTPQYSLTVSSTNDTQGTTLGSGSYESGTTVIIAGIAKDGFVFSQWNDGITDNPREVQVSANATYFANFSQAVVPPTRYKLTVMSTNESQGSIFGDGSYEAGTTLLIAAFAKDGYHFTQWNDGNTDNPRIVTVSADANFFANFAQDEVVPTLYELNVAPEVAAQGWTTEGCAYESGAEVMIYAHPADGFVFSQWSDGQKENPRFITVTSEVNLTAQFVVKTSTDVNAVKREIQAQKIIIDGKVFILRGDKVYTLQGQEVR